MNGQVAPVTTIEAANSKHRKLDVLPLHLQLASELKPWLKGMMPNQKLFPESRKKSTSKMVRKDLERVDIPYQTDEGIADFHAAGRHTHITELLRHGASLPEAQQLVRHFDIKQTMKYTHIGTEDQAKAVTNLPSASLIQKRLKMPRCICAAFRAALIDNRCARWHDRPARRRQHPLQ